MNTANEPFNQSEQNEHQYMTFLLAGETYGVDILRVQEIRGWEKATRVPNTPEYMKGVINLRGLIIPVFDLRERFNLDKANNDNLIVIVLHVDSATGRREMGIIADAVSEVVESDPSEIRITPEFGGQVEMQFIKGIVSDGDKMVMLLDVDKLLNDASGSDLNQEVAA